MVVNSRELYRAKQSLVRILYLHALMDILSYRHLHLITLNLNQLLVFKAKLLSSKRFQLYPRELNPSSKAPLYGENMSGENVSLSRSVILQAESSFQALR